MKKKINILMVAAILVIAIALPFAAMHFVSNVSEDTSFKAPVSKARIVETGFTDTVPTKDSTPVPLGAVNGSGKLVAYCKIDELDQPTNMTVKWILPDGTETEASDITVSFNSYCYSEQLALNPGKYTVVWQIYGKTPVESSINMD